MFREFDVSAYAPNHLAKLLSPWLRLGRRVTDQVDVSSGRVTAYLPERATPREIQGFEYTFPALIEDEAEERPVAWASRRVVEECRRTNGFMVAQDPTSKADAPYLERVKMPVVRLGEEVYHLAPPGSGVDEVEETIRQAANAWPAFMAVVTRGPMLSEDMPGGDIAESWASNATAILVEAYDGGNFLVWTDFVKKSVS